MSLPWLGGPRAPPSAIVVLSFDFGPAANSSKPIQHRCKLVESSRRVPVLRPMVHAGLAGQGLPGRGELIWALTPLSCHLLGLPSVRRRGSMSEELSLVPLHQRPELMEACAQLLGEEWGKSRASRLHSLQRSSDAFPTCLVLLQSRGPTELPAAEESPRQLLGHVRLSRVAGHPHSLFVESVVVPKVLREPVQIMAFLSPGISAEVLRIFSAYPSQAASTPETWVPPATRPSLLPTMVPPPPPLPPLGWVRGVPAKSYRQNLLETPHRDAKGLPIFWMKKDI
nr:PREDICTED: N-acetyltransferase 6 isoform X1 [Struthio camelus australis]